MAETQSNVGKKANLKEHTSQDTQEEAKWNKRINQQLDASGVDTSDGLSEKEFSQALAALAPGLDGDVAGMFYEELSQDGTPVSVSDLANLLASLDQGGTAGEIDETDISKIASESGDEGTIEQQDIDALNIGIHGRARALYGDTKAPEESE